MQSYEKAQQELATAERELHAAREAYHQAQEKVANAHHAVSAVFAARHERASEWRALLSAAAETQRRSLAYMGQS